jgi:hypothetical protein
VPGGEGQLLHEITTGPVIDLWRNGHGVINRSRPHGSFVDAERVVVSSETFEIIVRGRLSPTLVGALDGFEVVRYAEGLTYLRGWVPDQARLHSLLAVLRDLNIELKSVGAVEAAGDDSALEAYGSTEGEFNG